MKEDLRDELELIKLSQQGDKSAFGSLVIKYQYRVSKIVGRFTYDPSEVLDISQDAFIRAFKAIKTFRGECSFYTWIYRIAVNAAKNYIKFRSRRVPNVDIEISEFESGLGSKLDDSPIEVPEHDLINDEVHDVLFSALEELPEELKTALLLREVEGMTYHEIANIMSCPIGTVRSRIYRAKDVIEKRIDPFMSTSGIKF